MAGYKVIQDVEAEDKILGPLTLRQFIYAGIAAICLYLTYFAASHGAGFLSGVFIPFAVITGFFAFPWGKDQPTEVWALAKIRFMLKPRRRIWDQSGIKELVTVTAPKKDNTDYTNGLSQTEVRSRLRALADTIDSRGWILKNSNVNMFGQPALILNQPNSERLLEVSTLPQPLITTDVQASDDMLDEQHNTVAHNLEGMIEASAKAHRDQLMQNMSSNAPAAPATPKPANYWFLNQPAQPATIPSNQVTFNTQVVEPGMERSETPAATPSEPPVDERQLVQELEAHKQEAPMTAYYGHLHTVQPLSAKHQIAAVAPLNAAAVGAPIGTPQMAPQLGVPPVNMPVNQPVAAAPITAPVTTQPQVTPAKQAAILQLANNDDLNVATIAREAKRSGEQDEVVIKLH